MSATATERAYAFAKQQILAGEFVGGELISEGEVASEVGLSRTPVREAFLRLEAEGLLRLFPRRGALVIPVSDTEIEDVMETRQLVEQHAAQTIVREQISVGDSLAELIETQERLAAAGDPAGFVAADREFHRVIVGATENAILVALHDSLRDRQMRMGQAAIAGDQQRLEEFLRDHQKLLTALRGNDPARARELTEVHLDRTLRLLRSRPRSRSATDDGARGS